MYRNYVLPDAVIQQQQTHPLLQDFLDHVDEVMDVHRHIPTKGYHKLLAMDDKKEEKGFHRKIFSENFDG